MVATQADPFQAFAAEIGLRVTTEELSAAPRDVIAPPVDQDRYFLVSVARSRETATQVRMLHVRPRIGDCSWTSNGTSRFQAIRRLGLVRRVGFLSEEFSDRSGFLFLLLVDRAGSGGSVGEPPLSSSRRDTSRAFGASRNISEHACLGP
jgi:hypothetical protein